MSIPITIPVDANPIFTANQFSTTFNAFTLGRYDFTSDPANVNNLVLNITSNSVYIIEGKMFSMNTDEGSMQQSIDSSLGLPRLKLTTARTRQLLYTNAFPLINYLNDFEIILKFSSTQDGDQLLASFEGLYSQRGNLVGQAVFTAYLQMIIYEVSSVMWTGKFFDIKTDYGTDLNFRGR